MAGLAASPLAERVPRPPAPRAVLGRPAESLLFRACLFLYKGFGSENQETPDTQSFAARVSVKSYRGVLPDVAAKNVCYVESSCWIGNAHGRRGVALRRP